MIKNAICIVILIFLMNCSENTIQPKEPAEPQVTIISPKNNSIVRDTTIIEIEATDDKGVVKVELFINNVVTYDRIFYVEPYRYIWKVPQYEDTSKFRIYAKAYDGDDNVSSSNVIDVVVYKFQAPSNLQIISEGSDSLILRWKDNSVGESGFQIDKAINYGTFENIATVPANETNFIDTKLDTSQIYSYRIKALAEESESSYSQTIHTKYSTFLGKIANTYASYSPMPENVVPFQIINNSIVYCLHKIFRAWDFIQDKELFEWILYGDRNYSVINYNRSSDIIVTAPTDGSFLVYYFNRGNLDYQYRIKAFSSKISDMAFSSNNSSLYTLCNDDQVKIWKLSNGSLQRTIDVFHNGSNSISLNSDNTKFITAGSDSTIKVWVNETGILERTIFESGGSVKKAIYSADDNYIFSISGEEQYIKIWNFSDGSIERTLLGHNAEVTDITMDKSGKYLISGDKLGRIVVWSLKDNSIVSINTAGYAKILGLDIYKSSKDPDIYYVGSLTQDGNIQVWDLKKKWLRF